MLQRQTSLPPLDSSSSSRGNPSLPVCTHYYVYNEGYGTGSLEYHSPTSTMRKTSMRDLWKRIMTKKKRLLQTANVSASINRESYDPQSYAQNFDEGEAVIDPENLQRSFSARFTVPARAPRDSMLQRVVSERHREERKFWF